MSRNYPNFIKAYVDYVRDDFVPEKFHFWMCLATIAGALGRKVFIPWSTTLNFYPNIYLMFVARPGVGKSTAIKPGLDLLESLAQHGQTVNILPEQMTEAQLISLMSKAQTFEVGTKIHYQSAGFFAASEASNSLKDIYGGFLSCLTDFYDCPNAWTRSTKGAGDVKIVNACLSTVAGCTFDYLSKLVTSESIHGGFASRFIYIIQNDVMVRQSPWQTGSKELDAEMRGKLIEDLAVIGKLYGSFTADKEFSALWTEWFPSYDAKRQQMDSEEMQSLMVRKSTNLLKLCMLHSVAEANDLVLTAKHWESSMALLDSMEEDLPNMIVRAHSTKVDTQQGLNSAISLLLKRKGLTQTVLRSQLLARNFKPMEVKMTIEEMLATKQLIMDSSGLVRLSADVNK